MSCGCMVRINPGTSREKPPRGETLLLGHYTRIGLAKSVNNDAGTAPLKPSEHRKSDQKNIKTGEEPRKTCENGLASLVPTLPNSSRVGPSILTRLPPWAWTGRKKLQGDRVRKAHV